MTNAIDLTNTTLAVIAGGQGTRMGGPKVLLRVGGRPILAWLLDRLQWPGPTMLVTAPSVPVVAEASRFDRCAVDPVDGLGPLRGVLTAIEIATTNIVCAVAVDMPGIDRAKLSWLVGQLSDRPDALGAMSRSTSITGDQIEPFPGVYRTAARELIELRLASGRRSLHGLCDDPRFLTLPAPADWAADTWTNLNDPRELAAFESKDAAKEPT